MAAKVTINLDVNVINPRGKPYTNNSFTTQQMIERMQALVTEDSTRTLADVLTLVNKEAQEALKDATLGDILYMAIERSTKSSPKGSVQDRKARGRVLRILGQGGTQEFELNDVEHVIKADMDEILEAGLLVSTLLILDEATKNVDEKKDEKKDEKEGGVN